MNLQVRVPGEQISRGRKQIARRGVDILLNKADGIDWDLYDLLIEVVPVSPEKPES